MILQETRAFGWVLVLCLYDNALYIFAVVKRRIALQDADIRKKSVLTVEDVRNILRLGKNSTYDFIKGNVPFPIIRIGRQIRIPSAQFFEWLDGLGNTEV